MNGTHIAANGVCGESGMPLVNVIICHCLCASVGSFSHTTKLLINAGSRINAGSNTLRGFEVHISSKRRILIKCRVSKNAGFLIKSGVLRSMF